MTVYMADSINPWRIPRSIGGKRPAVAGYINGEWSWAKTHERDFGRIVRISVEPGQPDAARFARVLDVERFDARPSDVPPFVNARQAAGHHDATAYASISAFAESTALFDAAPRWWVAWYWERPGHPTRDQVVERLAHTYRVEVSPERIWACQYRTVPDQYDLSVVYGLPDFSR